MKIVFKPSFFRKFEKKKWPVDQVNSFGHQKLVRCAHWMRSNRADYHQQLAGTSANSELLNQKPSRPPNSADSSDSKFWKIQNKNLRMKNFSERSIQRMLRLILGTPTSTRTFPSSLLFELCIRTSYSNLPFELSIRTFHSKSLLELKGWILSNFLRQKSSQIELDKKTFSSLRKQWKVAILFEFYLIKFQLKGHSWIRRALAL